jgi:hypothetical protein
VLRRRRGHGRRDADDRGHYTNTYPAPGGFFAHGTTTDDYRVDFVDGRSAVGRWSDHWDFAGRDPVLMDTSAWQEQATVYGPDGQPLGTLTIHTTFHTRYVDANGNNEPDPGEITVSVDRARVTCP